MVVLSTSSQREPSPMCYKPKRTSSVKYVSVKGMLARLVIFRWPGGLLDLVRVVVAVALYGQVMRGIMA